MTAAQGTIPALPPFVGTLGGFELVELSNFGVSQYCTVDQIAARAVAGGIVVPTSRTIATPVTGGIAGGGDLSANRSFTLSLSQVQTKTTPVVADAVVINNSVNNLPNIVNLSDFYKSIIGLTHQTTPDQATYSLALYNSADSSVYRSTIQEAFSSVGTLPTGGTSGQLLKKSSGSNFDAAWSSTGFVTSVGITNGTGITVTGGPVTGAGSITVALANTAVTPTSYGSASQVPSYTVDQQGRLTSAANVTITPSAIGAVPTSRTVSTSTGLSGGGALSGDLTLSLANTAVSPGSYGDGTHVTAVTVDQQGRLTNATSIAISLSGLGGVPTSRTLTGGTGINTIGDLSTNRTISLANTAVTPGSYGTASSVAAITIDQQGRITNAAPTTITPAAIGAVPTTRAVNTATGLQGGGALSGDLTLNYDFPSLPLKSSPDPTNDLVAIYNAAGSAYAKSPVSAVGAAGSVASFNGRLGVVVPTTGDYAITQIAATTGNRLFGTDGSGNSGVISAGTGVTISGSTINTPWAISGSNIYYSVGSITIGSSTIPVTKSTIEVSNSGNVNDGVSVLRQPGANADVFGFRLKSNSGGVFRGALTVISSGQSETEVMSFGIGSSFGQPSLPTIGSGVVKSSSGALAASSLVNADVSASAAIDATKLAYTSPGTGAVAILVSNLVASYGVSVLAFGAVGNNVTDDRDAFQRAITYAQTIGARVLIPPTVNGYKIGSALNITSAISIQGVCLSGSFSASVFGSVLKPIAGITVFAVSTDDPIDIRDLSIEFPAVLPSASNSIGVKLDSTSTFNLNTRITNCAFYYADVAIQAVSAAQWVFSKCHIYSANIGVYVRNAYHPDAGDSTITECDMTLDTTHTSVYGIYQVSSGGLRIVNNKINGGNYYYVMSLEAGAVTGDLIIGNNSFEGAVYGGLLFTRQSSVNTSFQIVTITGNELVATGNSSRVIYVTDNTANWISAITIVGNVVFTGPNGGAVNDGIVLEYTSGFLIANNVFHAGGSSSRMIVAASTSDAAIIGPNLNYGGASPSQIASTNTTIIPPT